MKKTTIYILLILSCCVFVSCHLSNDTKTHNSLPHSNNKKTTVGKQQEHVFDDSVAGSKRLFQQAIDLQRDNGFFLSTAKDTLVFIKSAQLMEKAISLDSSHLNIYINLAKTYFKLGYTEKSIRVLDKLLEKNANYVEAITAKGFMYEKTGQQEKAISNYKQALNIYNSRANKVYKDDINKAFLMMLLYGKASGLAELKEVKRKNPNQDISFFENRFYHFDRKDFIQNSLQ